MDINLSDEDAKIVYKTKNEKTEIILTDDEKAKVEGMLKDFFEWNEDAYKMYNEAKEDMKKEKQTKDISKD